MVRGPSRTRTDLVGELGDTAWGFSRLRRYCFYARSTRTRVHARGVVCTARGTAVTHCAERQWVPRPRRSTLECVFCVGQSIPASAPGVSTRASRFCARLDSRAVEPLRGHCARGGLGWSPRGAAACGAVAAHSREWLYVTHSRRELVRRVVGRERRYKGAKACGWADSAVVSTSQFGMPPPTWWSYGLV